MRHPWHHHLSTHLCTSTMGRGGGIIKELHAHHLGGGEQGAGGGPPWGVRRWAFPQSARRRGAGGRRRRHRAPGQQAPPVLSAVRQRVSGERRAPPLTNTTRRHASLRTGRMGQDVDEHMEEVRIVARRAPPKSQCSLITEWKEDYEGPFSTRSY
jgi:hypothetical protein